MKYVAWTKYTPLELYVCNVSAQWLNYTENSRHKWLYFMIIGPVAQYEDRSLLHALWSCNVKAIRMLSG